MINTGGKRERSSGKQKEKRIRRSRANDDDADDMEVEAEDVKQVEQYTSKADLEGLSPEEKQQEEWDVLVEAITEKRSSSRLSALQKLCSELQSHYIPDLISTRSETLKFNLSSSIRKGDSAEVALACRALMLICVTLGLDSDNFLTNLSPPLVECMRNTSKSANSRVSVTQTVAFIHFIHTNGTQETVQAMKIFADLLQSQPLLNEAVISAAWDGWGLLASTLPPGYLGRTIFADYLPTLVAFLQHDSIDVRTAAGENIALMFEAKQSIASDEQTDDADMNDDSKRDGASGKGVDVEALIAKLREISTSGNRHIGTKKERATQRKSFREILATVESGEIPDESIKIEKSRHEFVGWSQVLQLRVLREVLASGLNTHFANNPLVGEIFDLYIEPTADGVDDPAVKAAARARSKAKAKEDYHERTKMRKKKTAFIHEADD